MSRLLNRDAVDCWTCPIILKSGKRVLSDATDNAETSRLSDATDNAETSRLSDTGENLIADELSDEKDPTHPFIGRTETPTHPFIG